TIYIRYIIISYMTTILIDSYSFFFIYSSHHDQKLPSFPTRRSSDLEGVRLRHVGLGLVVVVVRDEVLDGVVRHELAELVGELRRSEEHTSELQSRENLVCRLLL